MRLLAPLVIASALAACAPKTCPSQPMPKEYEEVASLLPAAAVVCTEQPQPGSLFLQFASRDVKSLSLETMLALRKADWALDATSRAEDLAGYIVATKGQKRLHIGINRQNGGPYVGRITGNVNLQDPSRAK